MKSSKISIKIYAKPTTVPARAKLVEVFHDMIRLDTLAETMIDVVDYGHVHHGPHVLFVGHESDYALDEGEGRVGLVYTRKRAPDPGPHARLADSLRRLFDLASKLEAEPRLAPLSFERTELRLRVLDRLLAPNSDATFAEERDGIALAARAHLGERVELIREGSDPREPFAVRVTAPGG